MLNHENNSFGPAVSSLLLPSSAVRRFVIMTCVIVHGKKKNFTSFILFPSKHLNFNELYLQFLASDVADYKEHLKAAFLSRCNSSLCLQQ